MKDIGASPQGRDSIIAARLRMLRAERGYSQADVAKSLGISQQTYSNYESKGTPPDSKALIFLCKLYGVSADYLLGLDDEKQNGGVAKMAAADVDSIVQQVLSKIKRD